MSTTLKNNLGAALSGVLNSYTYVFITSDTRSIDTINALLAGEGKTPAAAGFTSMTGDTGTSLGYLNVGTPVVGATTVTVTCSLNDHMTASAAGTAKYLVICSGSNMTSGIVAAVIPIGTVDAPVTMASTEVLVGDVIKLPTLTFTVPVS